MLLQTETCFQETVIGLCTNEKLEKKVFHAEEFLVRARQRAQEKLLESQNQIPVAIHDLPYLLRATRALIGLNNSIWDQCHDNQSEIIDGDLPFSRVSIVRIKTQVEGTKTTFHIQTTVTSKDFGALPLLPPELSALMSVPMLSSDDTSSSRQSAARFPDYAMYLDRATLLRDETLLPFLITLKDHLESLHVFLGAIESWLMEPLGQWQFLKDVFDGVAQVDFLPKLKDLTVPCGDAGGNLKCCTVHHAESSLCLRCLKPYSSHHWGMSRNGIMTHLCDYHGRNVGSFLRTIDHEMRIVCCRPFSSDGDVSAENKLLLDTTSREQILANRNIWRNS